MQTLPPKVQKALPEHVVDDEEPDYAIVGDFGQALVGFADRVLIIKPGWRAGSAFGARVTGFPYREIVAVEVNTGMVKGVLELVTAGHEGGRTKDYWSGDPDRDPMKVSNCLPVGKKSLRGQQPALDTLRERVKEAHGPPAAAAKGPDLAEQLAQLAQLRNQGALSEDEFARAKERLLLA
jgi:hypothetical protein